MSSIKVANVRDTSGTTGLTMNGNNTVEIAGERLVIDNLVLNGSVSGAGGAEYFSHHRTLMLVKFFKQTVLPYHGYQIFLVVRILPVCRCLLHLVLGLNQLA